MIALRFRESVRRTLESIRQNPLAGSPYPVRNPQLEGLRSRAVAAYGFIRVYYLVGNDAIHVVRILHGKRDVQRILQNEGRL